MHQGLLGEQHMQFGTQIGKPARAIVQSTVRAHVPPCRAKETTKNTTRLSAATKRLLNHGGHGDETGGAKGNEQGPALRCMPGP